MLLKGCACVCRYVYMHLCPLVSACMRVCMHVYMIVCISLYICMCVLKCEFTCCYMYIYICGCVYMHTCVFLWYFCLHMSAYAHVHVQFWREDNTMYC